MGDLVVISGYARGTQAIRVTRQGSQWVVAPAWDRPELPNWLSTPLVVDGLLFGHSYRRKGQLFCLDVASGDVRWATAGRDGEAAGIVRIGDQLVVMTPQEGLRVIAASGERFDELAHYPEVARGAWGFPALDGSSLVIRSGTRLISYRVPE